MNGPSARTEVQVRIAITMDIAMLPCCVLRPREAPVVRANLMRERIARSYSLVWWGVTSVSSVTTGTLRPCAHLQQRLGNRALRTAIALKALCALRQVVPGFALLVNLERSASWMRIVIPPYGALSGWASALWDKKVPLVK